MSKTKLQVRQIRPTATPVNNPSGKLIGVGTDEAVIEYKNGYQHSNVTNLTANTRNKLFTNLTEDAVRSSEIFFLSPSSPNTTTIIAGVDTGNNKFLSGRGQKITLCNNSDTPMFILSKFPNDSEAGRFNTLPYGITPLYPRTSYDFYYRDTGLLSLNTSVPSANTITEHTTKVIPYNYPLANVNLNHLNGVATEKAPDANYQIPAYQLTVNSFAGARATLHLPTIYRPTAGAGYSLLIRYKFRVVSSNINNYHIYCRVGPVGTTTQEHPINTIGVRTNSSRTFVCYSKNNNDQEELAPTVENNTTLNTVTAFPNSNYVVELLIHNNLQATASVNKVYIGTLPTATNILNTSNLSPTVHLVRTDGTATLYVESITVEIIK